MARGAAPVARLTGWYFFSQKPDPFSLPLVYGSDGCADEDEGEDEDECDDGDDNNEDGGNDGDGALPWRHPLRAYRPRPATACKLPLFAYYLLTICLLFAYPICYINSLGSAYLLIQFAFKKAKD